MLSINQPSEYAQLTFYPKNMFDLVDFTNVLLALNSEYNSFIRDQHGCDAKDRKFRLQVYGIKEGSVEILISTAQEFLFDAVLSEFFIDYFKTFFNILATVDYPSRVPSIGSVPISRLSNSRKFLQWAFKINYISKNRNFNFESDFQLDKITIMQDNIKILSGEKNTIRYDNEKIIFIGFHKGKNARVIAHKFSDTDAKTFLTDEVRNFLIEEEKNIFSVGNEYLANIEVVRLKNEIDCYKILSIFH